MKNITNVRKTVCIMANELKKNGYSLAQAFRKAWKRVKLTMTIRTKGTTFENRQERLNFLKRFSMESLEVTLERDHSSRYDKNAIQVVVHIRPINKKTVIGYVPKMLARELSKVIDTEIPIKATLMQIIGGYSYKENLGALIKIEV